MKMFFTNGKYGRKAKDVGIDESVKARGTAQRKGFLKHTGLLSALLMLTASLLLGCGSANKEKEEEYRMQGISLMEKGEYQAALDIFEAALDESVGVVDDLELDICMYKGLALFKLERYEEALEVYNAVIDFAPKNAYAYYYRGTIELYTGDSDGAITDYNQVIALTPSFEMYSSIAMNLMENGYDTASTAYLKQALLMEVSTTPEIRQQAYLYYINGDKEMSENLYEGLAADGDEASLVYLIRFAFERADYQKALSYAEQGLAMNGSRYQEFFFDKAVCQEYLQDYLGAEETFIQYLQLYPEDEAAVKEAKFLSTRQ